MGHVAGPHAVRLAREALETSASALVTIQSCGHLGAQGALGMHALLAAEAGRPRRMQSLVLPKL